MNIFEAVKQSVTTRQAAEHYGIRVNRNGMCVCPFHNDKNPSMKVDRRFHCFGCQVDGDVIDFVARLYGITGREAALRLVQDFSIPYKNGRDVHKTPIIPRLRQEREKQRIKRKEQHCFKVLSDYYHLLCRWETDFAPQTAEEEWNPRFAESMQYKSYVGHLLDVMLFSDMEERTSLINRYEKELKNLEQRMEAFSNGDRVNRNRSHSRSTSTLEH